MANETNDENRARRAGLVDRARGYHDALTAAIEGLERALAAAASTRTGAWSERVASELTHVREAIAAHVTDVEEVRGLLDEIELAEPRLAARVNELRTEHADLIERADGLARRVPSSANADFRSLRRDIASVLTVLRSHRGFEADLVFEAFWADIGAPD